MLKGAKTWDEMRAELPPDVQQRLDERANERTKARLKKRSVAAKPAKETKPAA